MKLLFILATILAFSLAEEVQNDFQEIADSEAVASNLELLRESGDLTPAANSYPPGQHWQPPQTWTTPANNYHWTTAPTTQNPVIKNEFFIGDGHYNYEYKLGDGTWVGEQGYYTSPNREEDSLVKKGWYSYVGPDGKTYTVNWYADKTGYHAFGDHLPKAPVPQQPTHGHHHDEPVVATTAKPVYTTYPTYTPRPVHPVHPTYTPRPIYPSMPTYTPEPVHPTKPTYYPHVVYDPAWPTPAPQPQHPSYVPSQPFIPPRPENPVPVPPYNPPQQTYYPPQPPTYYPQQPSNYVPNYNV